MENLIILFFMLLKIPKILSGHFSVIGPTGPIQASLGGEAELPCYLSPSQSAQHMEVVWFQSTQVVHVYRNGKDHFGDQALNYQGRTELLKDAITNGNITLKIRDVRFLDTGRYMCLIEDGVHQEEANMELKVSGRQFESNMLLPKVIWIYVPFFSVSYLVFLILMLFVLVSFRRSVPWMVEINGIIVLISTLEMEIAIFYLWMRLRCRGFLFDETPFWKDWKTTLLAVFLIITIFIPIMLQVKYFWKHRNRRGI